MIPVLCGDEKPDTPVSVALSTPPVGNDERSNYLRLAALLMAPGSRARALAPDGDNGGAYLGDGDVDELIAAHPNAAVLGKIRPDLVAIDLDGTAGLLDELEGVAALVGAVRVYLAASGSPDSLHVIFAPPTVQARRGLVDAAKRLSTSVGGGVDARSPQEWLRLPGSLSLKSGCGPVQPVVPAEDGFRPISATQALEHAQEALKTRRRDRKALGVAFHVREFALDTAAAMPSPRCEVGEQKLDRFAVRTSCELDDEARKALAVPCPKKADATLHALRAAWHLWRCGYRTWEDVAAVVMSSPALERWRRGGRSEAARRWRMESEKWAAWRPDLDEGAAGRLSDARSSAAVLPPDLEAVLLAVLEWMDKTGRVNAVPVAVRDLVVWGVSGSVGTAQRALEALEVGGVLVRARRWEDGPAEEATLWTLQPPQLWQVTDPEDDSAGIWNIPTHPPSGVDWLHPVWLSLGHTSRRLLQLVTTTPSLSTPSLAQQLGLAPSTVRGYLAGLEEANMVLRSRSGRSTVWTASLTGWESLPVVREAERAHRERVQAMGAERAIWRERLERARSTRSTSREEPFADLPVDAFSGFRTDPPAGELAGLTPEEASGPWVRPRATGPPPLEATGKQERQETPECCEGEGAALAEAKPRLQEETLSQAVRV